MTGKDDSNGKDRLSLVVQRRRLQGGRARKGPHPKRSALLQPPSGAGETRRGAGVSEVRGEGRARAHRA